jgi:hypothetical protein
VRFFSYQICLFPLPVIPVAALVDYKKVLEYKNGRLLSTPPPLNMKYCQHLASLKATADLEDVSLFKTQNTIVLSTLPRSEQKFVKCKRYCQPGQHYAGWSNRNVTERLLTVEQILTTCKAISCVEPHPLLQA